MWLGHQTDSKRDSDWTKTLVGHAILYRLPQSFLLFDTLPVSSLYFVASLSYSAACCRACFFNVSIKQDISHVVELLWYNQPMSRSFASSSAILFFNSTTSLAASWFFPPFWGVAYFKKSELRTKSINATSMHLFLQLWIFFPGMNKFEEYIERACQNKGEEKTETSEISVTLCTE